MNPTDILKGSGGIEAIARQLGISPQEAERGASALLPSILEGFGHRTGGDAGGSQRIEDALEQLGGGGLADNVIGPEPTAIGKGNDILGQIFGSKEVSREVASQAAPATRLDPALLRKMLPILAMLVGGYLSSRSRDGGAAGGGLGSILGPLIGSLAAGQAGGAAGGLGGGLGSILGGILGGGKR